MSSDLRNSLFALAVVLVIALVLWGDSKFAWPAGIATTVAAMVIAFARSWVVRDAKSKSNSNG